MSTNIRFILKGAVGLNKKKQRWEDDDFQFMNNAFIISIQVRLFISSTHAFESLIKDEDIEKKKELGDIRKELTKKQEDFKGTLKSINYHDFFSVVEFFPNYLDRRRFFGLKNEKAFNLKDDVSIYMKNGAEFYCERATICIEKYDEILQ